MRTLFVTDPPPVVEDWLAQRRALGQDRFDEVWEGEYHVAPYAHGRHGIVQHQLALVLGPFADRAGLRADGIDVLTSYPRDLESLTIAV